MKADPLQDSAATTPDSTTNWDAVDREIERLAELSRLGEVAAIQQGAAPLPKRGHDEDGLDAALELERYPEESCAAIYDPLLAERLHQRLARRRIALLLCASVLSVGSHYSTYTLGPIKKSLGTTEGGFAALISSFEVLNTVTPLLSGFLVPRYGASVCGLAATGAVLIGQLIVLVSSGQDGGVGRNIGGTVFGLLIFGSGTSPLAVVQESIMLKHNSSSSRFVARSVAAGLVLGKSASFAAGWSSQRLYTLSPRLPFIVAASLSLFSLCACALYALIERSTAQLASPGADRGPQTTPTTVDNTARFGTLFWYYIAVCGLAGTWYTTQHLSTHLLQAVYAIPQSEASGTASLLLGLPILLYPTVGWLVDKHPHLLAVFWLLVPSLTATSFFCLLLLSPVIPPVLALLPAAIGMGSGPLLLVLVVPRIVQRHQAPTALGAHKSLEMAGAIIFQTLAAGLLTLGSPSATGEGASPEGAGSIENEASEDSAQLALCGLLLGALVQLAVVARWWHAIRARQDARGDTDEGGLPLAGRGGADEAAVGLLSTAESDNVQMTVSSPQDWEGRAQIGAEMLGRKEREELQSGTKALRVATGIVVASWICFIWNVVRS